MNKFKIFLLSSVLALYALTGVAAEPVDINHASAVVLAKSLKGVGPAKARAIIDYRQTHGPFENVDQLVLVKGISQKGLDKMRHQVLVINQQE